MEALSFFISAWEYEKEEMDTYRKRGWISVWATEVEHFVVVYVYSCLYR